MIEPERVERVRRRSQAGPLIVRKLAQLGANAPSTRVAIEIVRCKRSGGQELQIIAVQRVNARKQIAGKNRATIARHTFHVSRDHRGASCTAVETATSIYTVRGRRKRPGEYPPPGKPTFRFARMPQHKHGNARPCPTTGAATSLGAARLRGRARRGRTWRGSDRWS